MANRQADANSAAADGSCRALGSSLGHHLVRVGILWIEALALCVLFTGYRAGTWDHLVLQVMGTHWADPGAFTNDAIALSAPQPHWAFDLLVELGVRSGSLQFLYFAYFAGSMLILAAGIAGIMHVLVPKAGYGAASLAVAILAASPIYLFGALNPVMGIALPAIMGTALCVAVVAAAIHEWWRLAAVALVVVSAVHVQLGVVALGMYVVLLGAESWTKKRLPLLHAFGAVLSALIITAGLFARPVYGEIADFVTVCQQIIPYHCDAKSWGWRVFASAVPALIVSACIAELAWRGDKAQRRWTVVVTALLVPEICFVIVDRLNVPHFAALVEGSNGYRLGSVIIVVAACSFASCIARADELPGLALPVTLGILYLFLVELSGPLHSAPGLVATLVLIGCLAQLVGQRAAGTDAQSFARRTIVLGVTPVRSLVACFVLIALLVAPRTMAGSAFALDRQMGRQTEVVTGFLPEGSVLLADPTWIWVRLQTRRAVVVDCKFVPFGGAPLREYFRRINDFGGWTKMCAQGLFTDLTPNQLNGISQKYGADFLLLPKTDARKNVLLRNGWGFKGEFRLSASTARPHQRQIVLLFREHPVNRSVAATEAGTPENAS